MKDKWTQQFHEKLDGYEIAAPEMEWTKLDEALAKNRRPSFGVIWGRRIAAAAAVALLVIGGARVLLPGLEAEKGGAPQQNYGERWLSHRQEGLSGNDEAETMPILAKAVARKREKIKSETDEIMISSDKSQQPSSAKALLVSGDKSQSADTPNMAEEEQALAKSDNVTHKTTTARRRDTATRRTMAMPVRSSNYHGGELTAAVFMQNAMTANPSNNMGNLFSSPMSNSPYGTVSEEFKYGTLDFLAASNPQSVIYDHDRPIKVGLSVKYNIDNRWSIVSGLTYSYLRSTFDYSEGKTSGSGVQKLHYVGLPLAVNYNVISAKNLKVYLTAGCEMQKLVSGKANMDGVNILEENKRQDVKEGGMQWSLNAAVGAEYNFMHNLGLYVEPGVSHYIDNHSSVENFYKYKPTNFSLNVGLRLSIR